MKRADVCVLVVVASLCAANAVMSLSEVQSEKARATAGLHNRAALLAGALRVAIAPDFTHLSKGYLRSLVADYAERQHIAGLAVVSSNGSILAASSTLPQGLPQSGALAQQSITQARAVTEVAYHGKDYMYASPISVADHIVGSLVVVQENTADRGYLSSVLQRKLDFLLIEIGMALGLVWLILRYFIAFPVRRLAAALRVARWTNAETVPLPMTRHPLLGPLFKEIAQLQEDLAAAKHTIVKQQQWIGRRQMPRRSYHRRSG